MIGWRARLGFIVPSINTVVEPEMAKMAPDGVSVHFARARSVKDTEEELIRMAEESPKAARELADAEVDVIAFACTGASFLKGPRYDSYVEGLITSAVNIPAVTTSTAVVQALRACGMKRVVVASPYEEWLNEREKIFLEACGIEVLAMEGLGINDVHISDVHPERVYRLARKVLRPDADGVFISCTDFRTAEILEVLENDTGKPVVSSNQATLWAMLRKLGLRVSIQGFGSLLRNIDGAR
ncbi:MAG: aspartate/glutamate racemase family protein [Firmicutes bacterium]|nr:aspartate/glutamate racemase family protein [Bacillota bacterium]